MFDYQLFDHTSYNKKGFSEMYELCFGQKIDENYVTWKYVNNPAGPVIGYTAAEKETIAGFYGVIPEKYRLGDDEFTVYQSMDTMTHPGFQKKGLFTALAEKTYQTILDKNSKSLIIGIPGSNSFHGFVAKLHWKAIHHFSFTFIHKHLFKLLHPFSSDKPYLIKEIHDFYSPEVSHFLEKIKYQKNKFQALIDPSFLTWRIKQNPLIRYTSIGFFKNEQLAGIVIYHITPDKKCFIDWIHADEAVEKKVILKFFCNYLFKKESFKYIYTWKSSDEKDLKQFKSLGFICNPFKKGPFSYKVPFIIYVKEHIKNGLDLHDIKNYDLQPIIQD